VLAQLVRPGDVVLDVGAGVGVHAVFLARAVGPRGKVVAIEPRRLAFQALAANAALNSLTNTWCFQAAAGAAPGTRAVTEPDPASPSPFGGAPGGAGDGDEVEVLCLDDLGLDRCRLLRIAAGGAVDVLRGATDLIARCRPALYVADDRPDRAGDLIRHVAGLGYRAYRHRTPLYNPDNYLKNPENLFGDAVSANLLCLPADAAVTVQGLPEAVYNDGG
jgi:FkbM family methyltransferase